MADKGGTDRARRSKRRERSSLGNTNETTSNERQTSRKSSDSEAVEEKSVQGTNGPSASVTLTPRARRQQRREQLRSKATGLGLNISTDNVAHPSSRKIVFDDEESTIPEQLAPAPGEEPQLLATHDDDSKGDLERDDDVQDEKDESDKVEEVRMSDARQEDQRQRKLERSIALANTSITRSKPRKHKKGKRQRSDSDSKGELELSEEFFNQLEAEREQQKQEKRRKVENSRPVGQRTTFVLEGEEAALFPQVTKEAEHNIQVVVLGAPPATHTEAATAAAAMGLSQTSEPPSAATLHYSRRMLLDGSDFLPPSQRQRAIKAGKKDTTTVAGWRRSKKMNRLLSVPGVMRSKNRQKLGAAAPHFVVRK